MAPLIIHLFSYLFLFLLRFSFYPRYTFLSFTLRAEIICIGIMFVATGIAHFISTESMINMFPSSIPFKMELVYLSGIFEIIAGLALIFSLGSQRLVAASLLIFLLISLPLNIYSAVAGVGLGAKSIGYLWFRIPLQFFWFGWIYYFIFRAK